MIDDRKFKLLNKAFIKYKNGVVGDYFSLWKRFNLSLVLGNDDSVLRKLHEEKDRFANYIKNVKDQNTKNMFEVLRKKRLQKVFNELASLTADAKIKKIQSLDTVDAKGVVTRRKVLQKWAMRAKVTIESRQKYELIQNFRMKQLMKTALNALRKRRLKSKSLAVSISNLEKLFRDKTIMEAFKNI